LAHGFYGGRRPSELLIERRSKAGQPGQSCGLLLRCQNWRGAISETGRLTTGDWLVTDDESRAQISVGEIGEGRLNQIRAFALFSRETTSIASASRGKMQAFIWLPGQFMLIPRPLWPSILAAATPWRSMMMVVVWLQ
jgi:hypothetical protein